MDPISLTLLFGVGAVAGYAMQRGAQLQARDDSIVLRQIYRTGDGWLATELMSAEALNATGQIMDLDLLSWWPKVNSGFFKVVILTHPGGPLDNHIVLLIESAGKYGWYLNQAHHHGYRQVRERVNFQRISDVIGQLNTDPAEEVVRTAAKISDPIKRYKYLRYALTANPQLSALLSQDEHFVDLVRSTVGTPQVQQLKGEQRDAPSRRQLRGVPVPAAPALPLHESFETGPTPARRRRATAAYERTAEYEVPLSASETLIPVPRQ